MTSNGILLIGPVPPPKGGVSIHIERLSARLFAEGIPHAILDESRQLTEGRPNLRNITPWEYVSLLRRFEIVHIHSSNHFVRLFHTIASRVLGCSVIHTVHSSRGSRGAIAVLRLACKLGRERIGVSEAVAKELGNASHVVPAFIAPRSVDEEISVETETWLAQKRSVGLRVIAANAFNTAKIDGVDLYGLDLIVEAFRDIRIRESYAAIICLSNRGPMEADFRILLARINELGLQDRINFVTEQVSFAGILRRCDVFLRPTITDGDAISVREALWYGKPAIASDAVARPQGAILFKSRDSSDLVERILDVGDIEAMEGHNSDFSKDIIDIYRNIMETP